MAFLQRLEVFDATIALLGGEVVDEKYDDWLGEGRADEESDQWECGRRYDFPTLEITLEFDSQKGHWLRIERYENYVYTDTSHIGVQESFEGAVTKITEMLGENQ